MIEDCESHFEFEKVYAMPPTEITREQWVQETERLCPSDRAFDAYVALEQEIVEQTDLDISYMSVSRGKSDYATFAASAGKCAVAQMYKGQCQLNWRWKGTMAGLSDEAKDQIDVAYETFRSTLDGKEDKGWETVKVLRLGEENVKDAVIKVAQELVQVVKKVGVKEEPKEEVK